MSASSGESPDRRLSVAVALVAGAAFVVLAVVLVPWSWVPGGHPVDVRADQVFTSAQIARAETYSGMQRHLSWAAYGLSVALSLVLGLTPMGSRLIGRLAGPWWCRILAGSGVLLLLGALVALPFEWRIHQHARAAGLSTQTAREWFRDLGVSFAISWVTTAIALVGLVALARRAPRRWPLWGALLAASLAVLGSFVWPVVVEPLFNDFHRLPDGPLRAQVLHLAHVEGVDVSDVLVADASRRTTTLNAYVSGFGSTRRVVLYDTLLRGTPRDQVIAVVAHELGHAAHRDVLTGTILGAAGGAAGVGLLGLLLSSTRLRRWSRTDGAHDPRGIALVLALATAGTFLGSPVQNTISRAVEARADRASLAATHDVAAFVALQRRLAVTSRADPTPPAWSQFWFGTHPTALQRIGIAKALAQGNRQGPQTVDWSRDRDERERGSSQLNPISRSTSGSPT